MRFWKRSTGNIVDLAEYRRRERAAEAEARPEVSGPPRVYYPMAPCWIWVWTWPT